jgi:electron transfer flavoprotein alpha subunit
MSSKGIWVYLEHENKEFEDVSLEILSRAQTLAKKVNEKVVGLILGTDPGNFGETAIKYGADEVIFLKSSAFEKYSTEYYTKSITDLIKAREPNIFLLGGTYNGRDLASRVAARLKTGLTANAISLDIDENLTMYAGVPGYGSKIIAEIVCTKNRPQMSTVRPGIFEKSMDETRKGKIEVIEPDLTNFVSRVRVIEQVKKEFVDISKSEFVTVAGNGVASNMDLATAFAKIAKTEIGVTRPLADRGLAPRDIQIGSTGISLKARLALVLGVSGAEHFVSGIANCKTVVAVDTDRNSNIFNYADYCVVADAMKLLPALIKEMSEQ